MLDDTGNLIRFNGATSDANDATSDANDATSDANSATSDANSATSIKKRMSRKELFTLIRNICQEWISLEDIVSKSERSYSYLRNIVIPMMLDKGEIEMLYSGIPNHPRQQYKVKK